MSLVGRIDQNHFYLQINNFLNRHCVVCFGVNQIEDYSPTQFYLQPNPDHDSHNFNINVIIDPHDPHFCYLNVINNPQVWSGAPVRLPIIIKDQRQWIDLTSWVESYSLTLLQIAYSMFENHGNEDLEKLKEVTTLIYSVKTLSRGLQMSGAIKSGKSHETARYSIDYIMNISPLPEQPMVGRVADSRIGYFYDYINIETETHLTGNPIALITKKNLQEVPWKYIVDRSIPKEFHPAVKEGILSWNRYFEKLGLGQPFIVVIEGDPDYPDPNMMNVFDMSCWYVVGTQAGNFNGPYSGFSMCITDLRSGQNLFGLISLNMVKVISNPTRYLVMNDRNPQNERTIQLYVSWVVTHEVGHQLGLRHNFMGNFYQNHISTIMDYIDIFNDLSHLEKYSPITDVLREYDLKAIEYGYRPFKDEKTGTKHPQLTKIAQQILSPFGTDENYFEQINPLVGTIETTNDPLDFIEMIIHTYTRYRINLLKAVKSKRITPFEYNNMFLYLYTQKYLDLSNMCLKYIGGRYHDKNRSFFLPVEPKKILRATQLLLRLLIEFEYSNEEYRFFIYDYATGDNKQVFNRIYLETIYSMNAQNLYYFYQLLVVNVFKGLTSDQRITRLAQNQSKTFGLYPQSQELSESREITPDDLFNIFSFTYQSDTNTIYKLSMIDGVFPEIGALLANETHWQERLLEASALHHNRQYLWVRQLVDTYKKPVSYMTRQCVGSLLHTLDKIISQNILPYLQTISSQTETPFWRRQPIKLLEHWTLISQLLKDRFDQTTGKTALRLTSNNS